MSAEELGQRIVDEYATQEAIATTPPLPDGTPYPIPTLYRAWDVTDDELIDAGWNENGTGDFLSGNPDAPNAAVIIDYGDRPPEPGFIGNGRRYCLYLIKRTEGGSRRVSHWHNDPNYLIGTLDQD